MKITAIETIRPHIQSNIVFVLVHTDDGVTGLGEAFFGPKAVEAYIHETAAPLVFAMNNPSPEGLSAATRPYLGYQGAGAETRGNAALELALWDILGKETGRSLSSLLGGPVRDELRVYNTCAGADYVRTATGQNSSNWGMPGGGADSPWEDLDAFLNRPAELARDLLSEGITTMKVWPFDREAERTLGADISHKAMDKGLQVIADSREAAGEKMDIMVELHGLWHRPAATKIMRELSQFNPFWVEDPIRPDSVDALIQLRRDVVDVPIATGETCVGRRGFIPLLSAGVIDYATVDVQWVGGLSEARKVSALADAYSVPVAPHDCTGPATLAACIHLAASQPNGFIQETVRAFLRTWYAELVTGLPVIENGIVHVPNTPGHGVTLREGLAESDMVSRRVSRR
jgi:galactonate dehydratase